MILLALYLLTSWVCLFLIWVLICYWFFSYKRWFLMWVYICYQFVIVLFVYFRACFSTYDAGLAIWCLILSDSWSYIDYLFLFWLYYMSVLSRIEGENFESFFPILWLFCFLLSKIITDAKSLGSCGPQKMTTARIEYFGESNK